MLEEARVPCCGWHMEVLEAVEWSKGKEVQLRAALVGVDHCRSGLSLISVFSLLPHHHHQPPNLSQTLSRNSNAMVALVACILLPGAAAVCLGPIENPSRPSPEHNTECETFCNLTWQFARQQVSNNKPSIAEKAILDAFLFVALAKWLCYF